METRIALFQKKEIRKTLHQNEWWFVIVDVVAALTDSANPTDYLKKMRSRDPSLAEAFKGGDKLPPPFCWSFPRLTAEIAQAAFGLIPAEHAAHKGLKRQNLRDHMTDLELITSLSDHHPAP